MRSKQTAYTPQLHTIAQHSSCSSASVFTAVILLAFATHCHCHRLDDVFPRRCHSPLFPHKQLTATSLAETNLIALYRIGEHTDGNSDGIAEYRRLLHYGATSEALRKKKMRKTSINQKLMETLKLWPTHAALSVPLAWRM